jgi:hypothetical protein
MIEGLIMLLIYICVLALAVYLILWVLEIIGISLPPKVVQIIWVIVILIVILLILRLLLPSLGHGRLLGMLSYPFLA